MIEDPSARLDYPSYWLRGDIDSSACYDAIVVGSGAAGGVAAMQLCGLGLNVLVLEAGKLPGAANRPWTGTLTKAINGFLSLGVEHRFSPRVIRQGEKALRFAGRVRQPVQSKLYAWALAPDKLVDDIDCPYTTDPAEPFDWFRSRQPGGRMFVPGHGRQYYRLASIGADATNDALPKWPIKASDLEPHYRLVESALRLRGGVGGSIPVELTETIEPTEPEQEVMRLLTARRPDARPMLGYHAPPADWLEMANAAGRLTCRAGAVVRHVRVGRSGRAEGVEWYDCESKKVVSASAPVIFLCASAIETTRILMLSVGGAGADAVGMHSPALGRYLMDHGKISGGGFCSSLPGIETQKTEPGRTIYIPSIDFPDGPTGMQIHISPRSSSELRIDVVSFSEILPDENNTVSLHPSRVDAFGMPVPHIRFRFSEAQKALGAQQIEYVSQVCADLGLTDVVCSENLAAPGTAVHESGTARMGTDPETSVVDPNNECWDAKGLYVTDAACFPRVGVQNPTLAIMALTARAAEHAAGVSKPSAHTAHSRQPAIF